MHALRGKAFACCRDRYAMIPASPAMLFPQYPHAAVLGTGDTVMPSQIASKFANAATRFGRGAGHGGPANGMGWGGPARGASCARPRARLAGAADAVSTPASQAKQMRRVRRDEAMLHVYERIVDDVSAPIMARIAAATAWLDRVDGKPIERVIASPPVTSLANLSNAELDAIAEQLEAAG